MVWQEDECKARSLRRYGLGVYHHIRWSMVLFGMDIRAFYKSLVTTKEVAIDIRSYQHPSFNILLKSDDFVDL